MSFWHKLKKLRWMSPAEIRWRIAVEMGRRRERSHLRQASSTNKFNDIETGRELLASCVRLVPGSDLAQLEMLGEQHPTVLERYKLAAAGNAEAILNARWTILGHPFDLTGAINWHQDVRTGYEWPRDFHADLPLYDLSGETDIKYPWELSRHQFLCELVRNYQLNNDDESAIRVRELMLDWIAQNPLYEGVNWTSALEVAMRAISWIWALAGLSTWSQWKEEDLAVIGASLRDHATYLSGNFSHYSSPYNHLIGEAAGLLCISTVFKDDKTNLKWRKQAKQVLAESTPKQFYQDHFGVEQAVGYHYYTLGFLVIALQAAQAVDEPLKQLIPIVHNAFKTGAMMRRPDGTWPAVGDLDSARAFPVHPENYWSFDSLQNLASLLFDDPSLKIAQHGPGEELFWLTGCDGLNRWNQINPKQTDGGGHLLKDAGYAVASDGNDWLMFDAGSIAHGLFPDATPSTAHGHADTLQVLYHHQGRAVLNDCGMPFYGGDQDWVTYFRSPAAHNTVQIEGADFVRCAGRLAWSHEVKRPEISAEFNDSAWLCRGKLTWPGVTHERHALCLPGQGLWVADLITSDRPRQAVWYWQLPEGKIALPEPMLAAWDSMSLSCAVSGAITSKLECSTATGTQPAGWRCLGYGEKQPGNRLSLSLQLEQSVLVLTSIGASNRPEVTVETAKKQLAEVGSTSGNQVSVGSLSGCRWLISVGVPAAVGGE